INSLCSDIQDEIDNTLKSLESCFSLILPRPEEFGEVDCSHDSSDSGMRLFGILKSNQKLGLEFDPGLKIEIKEDEDNSDILQNTTDLYTVIVNKFLPKTKAWIQLITKAEGRALTQKERLGMAVAKFNRLEIKRNTKKKTENTDENGDDEVSTDSELEEVAQPEPPQPLRGYREEFNLFTEKPVKKTIVKRRQNETEDLSRPSTSSASDTILSRKEELLKIAPKLPFDIDLYHWEDENLKAPTVVPVSCEGHRFWSAAADELNGIELELPGGTASLRSRVIEFTGCFTPVTRACSAPLPTGKLCPRRDRIKCPFHGIIVPRDEMGNIIDIKDQKIVAKSKPKKPVVPDWQDPQLLAELKATTGVDLKMPEKGERRKKKKFPGLTDIKKTHETPVSRLSKKIFRKYVAFYAYLFDTEFH
ncbi:hypothetical protein AAG570_009250, partial [Ranatra chinensis]